jgi:hypothetical protein
MAFMTTDLLTLLVGKPLTAVSFVLDYISFQFEDAFLTALSLPQVTSNSVTLSFGDGGYRDLLCKPIGHQVVAASTTDDEKIRIEFDDGSTFFIPFGAEHYDGVEAAILQISPEKWCVWRPGDR